MKKYLVIFVTVPNKYADKIINHLLCNKIVACVNKVDNIKSFYWWENKICKDKESLLIMKTKKKLFKKALEAIKKLHPYKVPEIISFEIFQGSKEYLNWIEDTTL